MGHGIYCSPKLEIALSFAAANNLGTQVLVQCRVRPGAIKEYGDIWVINDSKDIRPYGLIVSAGYLKTD